MAVGNGVAGEVMCQCPPSKQKPVAVDYEACGQIVDRMVYCSRCGNDIVSWTFREIPLSDA